MSLVDFSAVNLREKFDSVVVPYNFIFLIGQLPNSLSCISFFYYYLRQWLPLCFEMRSVTWNHQNSEWQRCLCGLRLQIQLYHIQTLFLGHCKLPLNIVGFYNFSKKVREMLPYLKVRVLASSATQDTSGNIDVSKKRPSHCEQPAYTCCQAPYFIQKERTRFF